MKRKSFAKTQKKITFPGEHLQKKIQTGEPPMDGAYICYSKPSDCEAIDSFPLAVMSVINFHKHKWASGKIVLGWIGPLPVLSNDELCEYTPNKAGLILFYIGTKEKGLLNQFKSGPYYRPIYYVNVKGNEDLYVFEVNSRTTKPKIIKMWDERNNRWIDYAKKKKITTWPKYTVCTIKQLNLGDYELRESVLDCMGIMPPDKRYYMWEIWKTDVVPVHKWNHGWGSISASQERKIKKRIR